jgi:hypothetical protein
MLHCPVFDISIETLRGEGRSPAQPHRFTDARPKQLLARIIKTNYRVRSCSIHGPVQ